MIIATESLSQLQEVETVVNRERIRQVLGIFIRNGGVAVTFWTVKISVPYAKNLDAVSAKTVKAWKHFRVAELPAADRTVDWNARDLHLQYQGLNYANSAST